jgi:hypothetical protein
VTGRKSGDAPAGDGFDRKVEESLSALATDETAAPPMGSALARELAGLQPATTRLPRREWAAVLGLSVFYGTGLLAWMGVRDDLSRMPPAWLVGMGAVWLAGFLTVTWVVLVPPRDQVMPRWRRAAAVAGFLAALLVTAGLLRPDALAATGTTYPATVATVAAHGHRCLRWGITVAALPVLLTFLAIRGAIPVGSRWLAAAIGAAGGALGGLTLHLHCPINERFHVGLVHGGLVIVTAVLAALAARVGEMRRG